ncbi:MAG: hypothetical protein ACRD96_15755 [Bryobacteraceae bacterium]
MAPLRWTIYTCWRRELGDDGKQFEQIVRMVAPSGKVVLSDIRPFELKTSKQRMIMYLDSFHVNEAGEYSLRVSLREARNENEEECASTIITVTHAS